MLRLAKRGRKLTSSDRFGGERFRFLLAVTVTLPFTFTVAVAGSRTRVVAEFRFLPRDWGLWELAIFVRRRLFP